MKVHELIKKLEDLVAENPTLDVARVMFSDGFNFVRVSGKIREDGDGRFVTLERDYR